MILWVNLLQHSSEARSSYPGTKEMPNRLGCHPMIPAPRDGAKGLILLEQSDYLSLKAQVLVTNSALICKGESGQVKTPFISSGHHIPMHPYICEHTYTYSNEKETECLNRSKILQQKMLYIINILPSIFYYVFSQKIMYFYILKSFVNWGILPLLLICFSTIWHPHNQPLFLLSLALSEIFSSSTDLTIFHICFPDT